MKRFIIFIFLFFIPVFSFAQEKQKNDDVIIKINVSKINNTLGKIIGGVIDEGKLFVKETKENVTPETKASIDTIKIHILYQLKYTHDAIHAGYTQGLRGEDYTPPYKNKYTIDKK